jgi:hypothetical protein
MKALICAVSMAVASVIAAAPAHAGPAEYLQLLDGKYPISTQQLLAEGFKICAAFSQSHMSSSAVVPMVQKDLGGVPVAIAVDIIGAAADNLNC